jgi:hypothetical protein
MCCLLQAHSVRLFQAIAPLAVIPFLGGFAKLRKATISFVMSVCLSVRLSFQLSAWNDSARSGRIFIKFDI